MKEAKNKKPTKSEEKELKHHTRRLSIKEGIFWTFRTSFGDYYIAPFTIAMGAKSSLIIILNSIWNLGPISQLVGSRFIGKTKRKKVLIKTLTLEAIAWLFIAFIGYLYLQNLYTPFLPVLTIIGLGLMVFAGGLGYPSWFSLMGDIVDNKFRGRWFSKRSTILSLTTIILAITAALILNYFKNTGNEIIGFIFLFLIAAFARFYCVRLIARHYEPELKIKKEKEFNLKKFIKELKNSNFGKFVLFRSMFAMATGLTAPLVSIYLLRYLQFDYLTFIIISLSGTFFSILTLNLWGKISDKYGNYKVIALTTFVIPLTPLLWILSTNKIYLFLVPAIIGGTAWTAFIMTSGNFIYDNVDKEKRGKAVSYLNLFLGIGAFSGGMIGALLIEIINTNWIEPIYLIFFIGTLARMIVVGFWIPKFKEIKHKKKIKGIKDFKDIIIKEAKPTILEDVHEIIAIKDYMQEK